MSSPSFLGATAGSAPQASQVNQFLVTHPTTYVYTGAQKDNQSTSGSGSTASNSTWVAQKFTAGSSYTSGRVVLTLAVTGSPAPWVVTLRPDNAGAPSATVLATITVPNSFVPGSANTVSMPLSSSLTSASVYWIVAQAVGDVSNHYSWSKSNQASGTSTSTNGTSWTTQAYGSLFQVWDNTVVSPLVHTWVDSGAQWATVVSNATSGAVTGLDEYTVAQGGSYVQSAASFGYANGLPSSTSQGAVANVTPPWQAAHNGLLGQADAIEGSAQINQLLGTHPGNPVYYGNAVVSPNGDGGGIVSGRPLNLYDRSQPFTMVGSTIGRVQIPVFPVGTGADLIVSLCNDNAGVPGTVITRTRVPASWINQLSAVTCVDNPSNVAAPVINPSGNPLATSMFNQFRMGTAVLLSWPYPSVNNVGGTAAPASCFYGSHLILVGGVDSNSNTVDSVFVATYDSLGTLNPALPTAALPTVTDGSGKVIVATDSQGGGPVVVQIGGGTTFHGATTATVFTAQLDANTGTISSWSAQTSLPYTIQNQGMAAANGFVYVLGGSTTGTGVINTVAYAQVQNTQITSWTITQPLPRPLQLPYCAVSNGFVFVIGGTDATLGPTYNTCYYAPINSDGSLGAWQTGPTVGNGGFNLDTTSLGTSFGIITNAQQCDALTVTPAGPGIQWMLERNGGAAFTAYFQISTVSFRAYAAVTGGTYLTMGLLVLPYISVPLPTTGLSNGTKYHILMQSPTNDPNNYLNLAFDDINTLPGSPGQLYSPKNTWSWTTFATSALPITIWDNSNNSANAYGSIGNNQVMHTWDDGGTRVSTLVKATTPDQRLLGILDATSSPTQLNANSGFETTVSPWTAENGTISRSNTQAFEGLFSLLLTPTGGFSTAGAVSELVPCVPGVSYTVKAKGYSPGGYANVNTQVNWYNSVGGFLSTSSTTFNVPAAAWTDISTVFTAPATAVSAQISLQESSSPTSGNTIFFDNAWIYETHGGPQVSSVMQIAYPGTWPGSGLWPPASFNELA